MSKQPSVKDMIRNGSVKRADAIKVKLDDIYEEPGFNERSAGPELDEYIEQMAVYISGGGVLPPLEIRPREGGGVWAVDGHCRRKAYLLARERGAPILWIDVRTFAGNDVDRVARIVSSNTNKPLTPLETSRVYKRLRAFGLSLQDIAAKVGRTRQHVEQLLLLADANNDVQQRVAAGEVSATTAIGAVRAHGAGAGAVLASAVKKAADAGKSKVTSGTLAPKPDRLIRAAAIDLLAVAKMAADDKEASQALRDAAAHAIAKATGGGV